VDHKVVNKAGTANNELFEGFNRTASNNILKIILGQSNTTNDDQGGSFAKSKVSMDVEERINEMDRRFVLDFLNFKFNDLLHKWGFPDNGEFKFMEEDLKTTEQKLKEDKMLAEIVQSGVFTPEELEEKYNFTIKDVKNNP
jgi:hypothetical protein